MTDSVEIECEDDVCVLPGATLESFESAPIAADIEIPEGDFEAWMDLAETRGWGDGLPLVPPTEARVEAFLERLPAHVDPDAVVAVLPPRGGLVTRRVLAVNAVMAGCRPETLPVLTTAVRGLAFPEINLRGVNATTHPVAPLLLVHGAATEELGFNAGLGAFGPGCRANASVGRALRLVLLNIAGARPGAGDAATQGQPSKYAYCAAENAAESPWETYPESLGVRGPSAVTVACGENPHNVQDHDVRSPIHTLEQIASTMTTLGSNNAPVSSAEWFVFLGPEHAQAMAAGGFSRTDVQDFLFEHARLPMSRFRRAFEVTQYADWENALPDDALKPIMRDRDLIKVMVVGGVGKHSCVMPSWGMTASATLALEPWSGRLLRPPERWLCPPRPASAHHYVRLLRPPALEKNEIMPTTLIYSPEGHTDALLDKTSRTILNATQGLRIAVLDNGKAGADHLLGRMGAELAKKTGGTYAGCFRKKTAATPCETELLDRLAKEVEVVLTGTADWGSCTSWSLHDTKSLEARGVATVVVASEAFRDLADQMAQELLFPDARRIIVPHPIGGTPGATLDSWADEALDGILEQLR